MDIYNGAATLIQSYYRGFAARKEFQTKKTAATKIQSNYRGFKTRKQISVDMETGDLKHKKKKKGVGKYVWNKMKHCWTKVTGGKHHHEEKKKEPVPDNELWELSQKPDGPDGKVESESEEEVDGYKIPKTDKPVSLLTLQKVYHKKHESDPDDDPAKLDPLVKFGAPIKSPYQSAYGANVSPYAEYDQELEQSVPRKPHKVIKYVSPEQPKQQKPVKQEEEAGFFSMFKKKEVKEGKEGKEEEDENILGQMGGKFMGLFQSKPAETEEKVKEEEKKEEKNGDQSQFGASFIGLFSGNKEKQEMEKAKVEAEAKPKAEPEAKPETEPETGLFGKFSGLFKPKTEETKPTQENKPTEAKNEDSKAAEKKNAIDSKPEAEPLIADRPIEQCISPEQSHPIHASIEHAIQSKPRTDVTNESEFETESELVTESEFKTESESETKTESEMENGDYSDYSDRSDSETSERDYSDREYSDSDHDSEYSDEESATKTEFQQKFMDFLRRDQSLGEQNSPPKPVPAPAPAPAPAPPSVQEESGFFTKMFKKEESAKPEEESGMGKMFGFLKPKS